MTMDAAVLKAGVNDFPAIGFGSAGNTDRTDGIACSLVLPGKNHVDNNIAWIIFCFDTNVLIKGITVFGKIDFFHALKAG